MNRSDAFPGMRLPVLFVVFNRPAHTERVFRAIRQARPERLYVAADGPREDRPAEHAVCEEVRRIATHVDWPCEVKTLFRDTNLGCGRAVSDAIDWLFASEEEGIILEDDCVPHPSFFRYVEELLARYRDDRRVMAIAGTNIQGDGVATEYSYFHSRFSLMWGWATWRRAWALYDRDMRSWPRVRETEWLRGIGQGSRLFERKWRKLFDEAHAGAVDTWDYQWIYSCWRAHGLTVLPARNLIRNTGFGEDATHTRDVDHVLARLEEQEITFPLCHPPDVELIYEADRYIAEHWFGISWQSFLTHGTRARVLRVLDLARRTARRVFGRAAPSAD